MGQKVNDTGITRDMKLFAACVQSLRTAEKEAELNNSDFYRNIVRSLQFKVDRWLEWIHDKERGVGTTALPPFVYMSKPTNKGVMLREEVMQQLKENHSDEEMAQFMATLSEG